MAEYIHIPTGTHVEAEGVLPLPLFLPVAPEGEPKEPAKPAPRKRTAKKAATESR